jgi:transglutaminase-like putative cysteine protease
MLKIVGLSLIIADMIKKKENPVYMIGPATILAYLVYQKLPEDIKTEIKQEFSGTILGKPVQKRIETVSNIDDRVRKIQELIDKGKQDYTIRQLAGEIVSDIPEKDYKSEVLAIANYVKGNVRYTKDVTGLDTYQHPVRTLELGIGDCDCISALLCSLLNSIGHETRLKVIQTKGNDDYNHIYPLVKINDKWIPIDLTVNKPIGWEPPKHTIIKEKIYET